MKANKESVLRLIKTARGQLDGIERMIEDDRYCVDISTQLLSTQAILNKANREILKGHVEHCVKEAILTGDVDVKLNEILMLMDKMK
ncbi:metal-sensing transcriptional repressor [Dielma fastidiosa]|uniref:Copper-sensing transcriptional repressor CsoR n=1 Tax=Dielma fastidiosa TaxID=1034346 RepID=A0A318L8R9_9FIRM|nr:metal-sensing transcriptional repressor [Dielma fastidiosa]PXX78097.1 DNA-binding FrmR family transcriptional regulator [Dielma fastidiosa]